MKYTDKVTIKVIVMLLISLIGIPAYFLTGGSWELALLYTVLGHITNNLAQICYHRWLCHDQFKPTWFARKLLLFSTVVSAVGPPGHNVVAHMNHHKYSDTEKDTHSPKHLGWWKMYMGRYRTPDKPIGIRFFSKQKDAVYVTKNYWKLYAVAVVLHALIDPWLVVWMAFNFTHAWYFLTYLNYFGHDGRKGVPSSTHIIPNLIMWGEGYHDKHHEDGQALVLGKWDFGGKFVVPKLLSKKEKASG